jgi:hypothetical protein
MSNYLSFIHDWLLRLPVIRLYLSSVREKLVSRIEYVYEHDRSILDGMETVY